MTKVSAHNNAMEFASDTAALLETTVDGLSSETRVVAVRQQQEPNTRPENLHLKYGWVSEPWR